MAFIDDLINRTLNGDGNSDQHTMTIFSIALQLKAKNILELGVYKGDTSQPLTWAAKLTGGKVTSVDKTAHIDIWQPPEELQPYREFVMMDAIEFLVDAAKKGNKYDLIYVDDWHAYKHVKRELQLIDQMITNESIILLHDLMAFTYPTYHIPKKTSPNSEWEGGGPTKAVFELNKDNWEWSTIPVNNGLTILRRI